MADSTLTLYYTAASPPSRAILLLARALRIKLKLENVDLAKREQLKESFIKMNPQHSVPCLKDGDFVISESFAIMTYLIEVYTKGSKLYPQDPKKKAVVHQRVLFVNGTLFPRWAICYIIPVVFAKTGKPNETLIARVDDSVSVVNNYLKGHKWFAGDELTIADYSLFSILTSLKATEVNLEKYDNVVDWMKRCTAEFDGVTELDTPGAQELAAIYNSCKTN